LLYKKYQLLILDEVTSAMDRNTEKFSLQILQKIKNDCIILFISHRLHTLKQFADTIYVLRDGIISNSENHEELMQSDNFYSDYWKV
jgi:ABC-type multidrug transport system fused ATPase/permease subunit